MTRSLRLHVWTALVLAGFCALGQNPPSADKGAASDKEQAAPASAAKKEYVGSEICQGCHEDIFKGFEKNRHHAVEIDKGRGWSGKACEACHGPASVHTESMSAADIINPAKLTPGQADKACLKCHSNQPTHIGRIQGGHGRNGVACVGCHSMHKADAVPVVNAKPADVNKFCAGCHSNVWAQFQKPYKHRLPEGAMSCVDCHNPHGGFRPKLMQSANSNDPGCMKCHGEKRGPFTFEHAPVRSDGCSACHEPHGSANPRMLVRHEEHTLCLECHANFGTASSLKTSTIGGIPPAFHDIRSPRFRNCTVCHTKIHGSYVDRTLTR